MRGLALAIVVATSGCALAFDDEQYSENLGKDAVAVDTSKPVTDATVDDTSVAPDTVVANDTIGEDLACPGAEVRCSGTCTSLTSIANCGACGNDCAKHGATATCVAGKCTCPGDRCPATGDAFVCTTRSEDPLNCGTCGNKCPDGEYCKAGACSCMPPLVRCSSTSGCVDIGGHHDYCGSCTRDCTAANNTCRATSPLSDGSMTYYCTLDTYGCPSGRTHCYGDHCFDTKVDETNCGGCGVKCASNQVCANSICRTYTLRSGACASGEADCSALPGNTTRVCVAGGVCPG
jgi:hypothetical protein